jgi:hypothetical protein
LRCHRQGKFHHCISSHTAFVRQVLHSFAIHSRCPPVKQHLHQGTVLTRIGRIITHRRNILPSNAQIFTYGCFDPQRLNPEMREGRSPFLRPQDPLNGSRKARSCSWGRACRPETWLDIDLLQSITRSDSFLAILRISFLYCTLLGSCACLPTTLFNREETCWPPSSIEPTGVLRLFTIRRSPGRHCIGDSIRSRRHTLTV